VVIPDTELCDSPHFACNPGSENLSALFLAEAGAREVAFTDEGDDVDDQLVLV
jgi:hypothetical protein